MRDASDDAGPDAFGSLDDLLSAWDAKDRRWDDFLRDLNIRRIGQFSVDRAAPDGEVKSTPTYDALTHICLHAGYTAAQCVNMLRHLGAPVPDVSLISMSREQHADGPEH